MDQNLSSLAKNLAETLGGKGKKETIESVVRLLSTDNGKKILAALLADGGESVRRAAESAKSGDLGGVQGIISAIAGTPEGESLLRSLGEDLKK